MGAMTKMRCVRFVLLGAISTQLVACGLWGGSGEVTLASLDKRKFVEREAPAIEEAKQKALSQYQVLLERGAPVEKNELVRQVADIQLAIAEAKDAEAAETQSEAKAGEALEESKQRYADAVAHYQNLIQAETAGEANPEVYYQLSRAYQLQGNSEMVLATLTDLVKRRPGLENLDEVQFRRGELLFERRDYEAAAQAYQVVLQTQPTSSFYQQALYKQGWTLFKLSQFKASTDLFIQLIDSVLPGKELGQVEIAALSGSDREWVEDSFRAISLNFSYQEKDNQVGRYFDAINGRHYEDQIYDRLAALLFEKKRYSDAAEVNLAYVNRSPASVRAPYFTVRAVDSYQKGGFPEKLIETKKKFVNLYQRHAPAWKQADATSAEKAQSHLESYLIDLSSHYHALAQQTDPVRNKEKKASAKERAQKRQEALAHYGAAVSWYRLYLANVPSSPKRMELHFLLAEALYESERYEEAAKAYEDVAYVYPVSVKSAESGYAALLAYEQHQKRLPALSLASQEAQNAEQKAAVDWRLKGIDSALRFADRFPAHAEVLSVLARTTEDLYQLQAYDRAMKVAGRILNAQPPAPPKYTLVAWRTLAHAAFEEKDFAMAEKAYRETLARLPKQDKTREETRELLAVAIYRQAEVSQQQGNLAQAVSHFRRVLVDAPGTSTSANALFDAASVLITMENWQEAALTLEGFRKTFPRHALQPQVAKSLAVVYMESGQKQQAAMAFERIANDASFDQVTRRDAGAEAAALYAATGETTKAITAYKNLIQQYPQLFDETMEWRQQIVDIADGRGDQRTANDWRRQIIEADRKAGKNRSDRSRYLAANASLKLAETTMASFSRVKLKEPFKKTLAQKTALMKKAIQQFEQVAGYGVLETTTATTYYSGEIYHQFSQAWLTSPRPRGLNQLEAEQYDLLLEEKAFPYEEKAIEILSINADRVTEGVFDKWVRKSLWRLSSLQPARYAKYEQTEDYVATIH